MDLATEQKCQSANELNFRFSWDERISENDGKPIWGNYDIQIRTITIFLGTFGKCLKRIFQEGTNELFLEFSIKGWFEEFSKTIQEECLHACIEDIRGKVEKNKEEWIIDRIEEMVKTNILSSSI